MPTPTKGARLGGSPAHERLILANLASQLFEHGRIVTTEAKARRLRPLAEKLITKAKRGDLHSRRQVMRVIKENADHDIVHVLFTEIAPSFADRDGGYTRITKVGPRKGDNAPMAVIELVTESVEDSRSSHDGTASRGTAREAAPIVDEDVEDDDEEAEDEDSDAATSDEDDADEDESDEDESDEDEDDADDEAAGSGEDEDEGKRNA